MSTDLKTLDRPTRQLVQYGLIHRGYLRLPSPPTGAGGPLTDAAHARWVGLHSGTAQAPGSAAAALAEEVLRVASRYVGLKEVRPNREWDDPRTPGADTALSRELREMMHPVPWTEGWAYCIAFAEGVVVTALRNLGYPEDQVARFAAPMGAHVLTAYRALERLGIVRQQPVRGALWFARHGKTASGHLGIVRMTNGSTMATVEANTSSGTAAAATAAQEREGDWIDNKTRSVRKNGRLTTLGFLHPADILALIGATDKNP